MRSRGRSRSKRRRSRRAARSPTQVRSLSPSPHEARDVKEWLSTQVPQASNTLLQKTVDALKAADFESVWQIMSAPKEVLVHVLPPGTHGLALTTVLAAQAAAQQAAPLRAPAGGGDMGTVATAFKEVAKASEKVARAQRAQIRDSRRQRRNRSRSFSSSGSEAGAANRDFDANKCLEKNGLPTMDHMHLVPCRSMRDAVMAARQASTKTASDGSRKKFMVPGAVQIMAPAVDERQRSSEKGCNDSRAVGVLLVGPRARSDDSAGSRRP